jgi:ATP-dependent Clp protease ATP-binding subunit ClpC
MKGIVKEAIAHPHIILFIDEIHTLVGAGRTEGGSLDAANLLKPALARGEVRVIGATTLAEYRKHFESDAALERRFQPITIEEPTAAQAVALLTAVAAQYEDHHDVEVAPSTVQACVELAVRYLPDRRLPDKALDLLDEACADASLAGHDHVDVETVARVVAERTGIAVGTLTEGERERLGRLDAVLAERVVAQDQAVHTLVAAVRRARTGLTDPKRPRGVFLFVGGSGVGKTELARALADTLFPDGPALVRIDMSEFGDRFTGTRLVGAPPGYVGHGEEGQLTGKLRRRPYAVVLLDEIEKAHPDVQAMFLSLFDEGTIEDSEGRRVQAREAIFVATTNAGTEIGARGRAGFSPGTATEVRMERLKPYFRPELLNRFDAVVFFEPLDATALRQIARAHLERLRDRVIAKGIHLRWSEAVVERVAEHGADPKHGARPVLRAIRTLVEEPLGDLVIADGSGQAMSWYIDVADGTIRFERDATTQDAQPSPAISDPATG